MQVPKIVVMPRTLSELLAEMALGKLQVPRFQRSFVWAVTKTRALLDSMYKEFPIGTFFLWRAPAGSPSLFRPLTDVGIPEPQPGSEIAYILDGQQRLTSLFVVIKAIRVGNRDYGRICIDLETATKYDHNTDEGFEEDIFVYRSADNQRYVTVHDLVGEGHLPIYDSLPKELKPAFQKARSLFYTYPFSVVWILEQKLADAVEIFQRINQAGQRLSRFDLVCANVWRGDFDFRKRVTDVNKSFAQKRFGELDETVFTQTFALVLKDKCTTLDELSLETDDVMNVWDRVVRALELAVDFVVANLGVKRTEYLPYRGVLPVIAHYFYHAPNSALSVKERETLWSWFWQVAFSERYSSTSPSRMAEDAQKLRELLDGREVAFNYPSKVTVEAVARTKMTSTSSVLRNATICMLALKQPKSFKDGSPVNLGDDFFSDLKKAERHHIFPVGHLRRSGVSAGRVHTLPNFAFIPADLNREIGSRPPSEYLSEYRKGNPRFDAAAESHLLSLSEDSAVWEGNFDAFIQERATRLADELNQLVGSSPSDFPGTNPIAPKDACAQRVDSTEISLRGFIDHRLTAVNGPSYWKHTIPGDVIANVKKLIDDWLSRFPYEDPAKFSVGRLRLDFCDASDYEKIILKNWASFGDFFRHKDEFQRHITAYRVLRNCVQHNREYTDIELKLGEAAMTWLGRILDQYDHDVALQAMDNSEEPLVTEETEV